METAIQERFRNFATEKFGASLDRIVGEYTTYDDGHRVVINFPVGLSREVEQRFHKWVFNQRNVGWCDYERFNGYVVKAIVSPRRETFSTATVAGALRRNKMTIGGSFSTKIRGYRTYTSGWVLTGMKDSVEITARFDNPDYEKLEAVLNEENFSWFQSDNKYTVRGWNG